MNTQATGTATERLPQLIQSAASQTPNAVAVQYLDDSMSYRELLRRANQLAQVLVANGTAINDRVGILLDKSIESVIAVYGVMLAGAAYVPLDCKAPASRIAFCIANCDVTTLVTTADKAGLLASVHAEHNTPLLAVGLEQTQPGITAIPWANVDAASPQTPKVSTSGDDLCYIIYTSGSTGAPKGIMHTHKSSLAFVTWAAEAYGITASDRFAGPAPLYFDMSVFDIFVAHAAGAATVIVPNPYMRLPASYSQWLQDQRITMLFTVPYALSHLLQGGALEQRQLGNLRWVVFGGDIHNPDDIVALMSHWPHTRFSHMYGPAETNGCTYRIIEPGDAELEQPGEPFHIGKPCEGMQALVVDANDQPIDRGIGELLIQGPSVMRGYWAQPELSAERLIQLDNTRYYRTGDLVEVLADGNLRFAGRNDRMVKIRGFRIELDEVETALAAHPLVREGAAICLADPTGSQRLLAAVLTDETALADSPNDGASQKHPDDAMAALAATLRRHLFEQLPAYAQPETVLILPEFPRTGSGKLDRRALAAQIATQIS